MFSNKSIHVRWSMSLFCSVCLSACVCVSSYNNDNFFFTRKFTLTKSDYNRAWNNTLDSLSKRKTCDILTCTHFEYDLINMESCVRRTHNTITCWNVRCYSNSVCSQTAQLANLLRSQTMLSKWTDEIHSIMALVAPISKSKVQSFQSIVAHNTIWLNFNDFLTLSQRSHTETMGNIVTRMVLIYNISLSRSIILGNNWISWRWQSINGHILYPKNMPKWIVVGNLFAPFSSFRTNVNEFEYVCVWVWWTRTPMI